MTSKDFILSSINYLVSRFPWISCRYEFKKHSKSHFIEVLPAETYEGNADYANEESKILLEFVGNFPDENICFITAGSAIELTNPEYSQGNMANLLNLTGIDLKTILNFSYQTNFPVISSQDFEHIAFTSVEPNDVFVFSDIAFTRIANIGFSNPQVTYIEGESILPEFDQEAQLSLAA